MLSSSGVPEEVASLLADVDSFISDILKGENLSKRAKEKRDALIKKIKDVKSNYPQEFPERGELEDGEEHEGPLSSAPDNLSDRYDKDDEGPSDDNLCGTQSNYPQTNNRRWESRKEKENKEIQIACIRVLQ